jgi:hypothetical protein
MKWEVAKPGGGRGSDGSTSSTRQLVLVLRRAAPSLGLMGSGITCLVKSWPRGDGPVVLDRARAGEVLSLGGRVADTLAPARKKRVRIRDQILLVYGKLPFPSPGLSLLFVIAAIA